MTIRNLDALFRPKAIALVGASNEPNSVGSVIARNLLQTGFAGPVLMVNPHETAIRSTLNYTSITALPAVPDLAVIATPPDTVPEIVAELGAKGCRAAVIITAGFGEGERAHGQSLRQAVLDAARPTLLRVLGPNCLGFLSPVSGINASFAHLSPAAGRVAFISQSGALATAILDWGTARDFGFSHVISVGDMADVDFGDLLDYLALDPSTDAILLYIESLTHPRKFMSAARKAARAKRVVALKAGRSEVGARAALSHTGALAGSDLVYDAAIRRAGILRVYELRELFEAVVTLSSGLEARGDRLAVLTNGGGAGVLAADALQQRSGRLASLSPDSVGSLDSFLPAYWSRSQPVDILGDAAPDRYARTLKVLLADPSQDAVLVLNCPTALSESLAAAEAVVSVLAPGPAMPVLTCWLGDPAARRGRALFAARHVPTYETPDDAVRAFMHLVEYRRNQDLLLEVPPAAEIEFRPQAERVRALVDTALAEDRQLLSEPEAKAVLSDYGIACVETRKAADPKSAGRLATEFGCRVALKILSPDISHKSRVGGVRLDLEEARAVERAAAEMLEHVAAREPDATISGFVVEPMIDRNSGTELLAGIANDPLFGPIVLFGAGGTAVEGIADRVVGLPPLNLVLAREMIGRTRIGNLLTSSQANSNMATDLNSVATVLMRLSQITIDFPEIAEFDINPLFCGSQGVTAIDARAVVRKPSSSPQARLAIRPYPTELEHVVTLHDGTPCAVRPIRPTDRAGLIDMLERCSADDIRMRFFASIRTLPPMLAARLSMIDYDREMAFVATPVSDGGSASEVWGVGRLASDPDNERAEFALIVRSDFKGRGLGFQLMTDVLSYGRRRGLNRIVGDVLRTNSQMLQMAREFGFSPSEELIGEIVRLSLSL